MKSDSLPQCSTKQCSTKLWERFQKFYKTYSEVGISLDISRISFNDSFLENISDNLQKSFQNMKALEDGEHVNVDEDRMVGHYWLRNPELAPNSKIADEIKSNIEKIKSFSDNIHKGAILSEKGTVFKNVVLIGIGGSSLGPQLVSDCLRSKDDKMKLFFADNTDPHGINRLLETLGLSLPQTLCIVASKSGGTIETNNCLEEFKIAYKNASLNFSKHAAAVTVAGSELDNLAKNQKWLSRFHLWDWVGGRTSLFSAVGLLPAALQGFNTKQMLAGAREMDELTRSDDPLENPAALLAQMWFFVAEKNNKRNMVILPYKDRLLLFSKYLQQLIMESLGKEKDLNGKVVNQGLTVFGNKGSTDQHAFVQQLRDGINDFFVTFIEVLNDRELRGNDLKITTGDYLSGFFLGTRKALSDKGRESITITLDEVTPHSLSALIALYERAVGLYASLININAYNQPGVEAGKEAASDVIELQQKILTELSTKALSVVELSEALKKPEDAETIYKILEHLSANPSSGVKRVSSSRHPKEAKYLR